MQEDTQHRFDEVLDALKQERQRVDEDLKRLTAAAAYLTATPVSIDPRVSLQA